MNESAGIKPTGRAWEWGSVVWGRSVLYCTIIDGSGRNEGRKEGRERTSSVPFHSSALSL